MLFEGRHHSSGDQMSDSFDETLDVETLIQERELLARKVDQSDAIISHMKETINKLILENGDLLMNQSIACQSKSKLVAKASSSPQTKFYKSIKKDEAFLSEVGKLFASLFESKRKIPSAFVRLVSDEKYSKLSREDKLKYK